MSDDEFYRRLTDVTKLAELKPALFDNFIKEKQSILKKCIIFLHSHNETKEEEKAINEYSTEILNVVQKYSNSVHTYEMMIQATWINLLMVLLSVLLQ